MGQKVHPLGFRLGVTETWQSRWYKRTKQDYAKQLHQDFFLREFVGEKLKGAGVSDILIERFANRLKVSVRTARPGLVIGKKGKDIEDLRQEIKRLLKSDNKTEVNIIEIRKPDLDAQLVELRSQSLAVLVERISLELSGLEKVEFLCIRLERRSIMELQKLSQLMA